jgi:DNA-binding response OmpR family regulator
LEPRGATVLLVEDEARTARSVVRALGQAGYHVWHAENAADARAILGHQRPDLVVLDLSLPDVNGLVFCTWLCTSLAGVPILACGHVSARERVLCLQVGAADVLAKPFDLGELELRLRAIARHARPAAGGGPRRVGTYDVGPLHVDLPRWRASLAGRALDLTPTEFQLLSFLMQHAGEVVSRKQVAGSVWGDASMSRSRTIDAYVRRLRAKLSGPGAPSLLNVHAFGFVLVPPAAPRASVG